MSAHGVTILMPAYNAGRFLGEAIQSVLDQSFRGWELWVLDDGSTDDTRAVGERFRKQDARILVFPNQENLGRTRTLNRALARVETEFCARHDADDRSHVDRLSKQVALLRDRPEVGLCSSFMRMMDEGGRELRVWEYPTGSAELRQAMLQQNCICHGAVIFRTERCREVGGYRELFRYAEDYDLWLRMMERTDLEVIPEPLYDYRMHKEADSQARNYEQHCEVEFILELAIARRDGRPDTLAEDPEDAAARLEERFADRDQKLDYYMAQHAHAKQYIAELEHYRDELLRELGR